MDRSARPQDVTWFLDQRRNGQLELDPPYQRRSVWSPRDRRYFLDTIFRGYPSPAIFLYKRLDEAGKAVYDVVDGKQRLETLFLFVDGKIAMASDYGDSRLDGKKWRNLDDDLKHKLWNYELPVEFIKIIEGNVLNEVFARLNRNSRKLEPQEIRHARNDGWFISFAEREAEQEEYWKTFRITTTARSRRMKDVQFISELLLVVLDGKVIGFDQEVLDAASANYDSPEELNPDFDPDEVAARFGAAKEFLAAMDRTNGCVRRFATTLNNFYSLWAWVVVSNPPLTDAPKVAEAYGVFMESVAVLKEELQKHEDDLEAFLKAQEAKVQETGGEFSRAFRYVQNATGASTEPQQRQARHEVLLAVLSKTVSEPA
ncbi:MAG: DUF262 domain-containing protein [Thermoanaerobaculia bacterium]|nr:DUF262 domain-containing protein [Thermoanaerobaculia bacterium]